MTRIFAPIASGAGLVAAAAGLVYTVTFALVVQKGYRWALWASSIALLIGALAALVVFVAAHRRFTGDEPDIGLLALIVGTTGAMASVIHAVFDLAVLAKPGGGAGGPFPVDPRGFGTFALTGVALGLFGWLGARSGALASRAQLLALGTAACLLIVFIGRLVVLNPKSGAVKPFAILAGIVLAPATYVVFARSFVRADQPA
jgi:hypothetical protein